VTSWLTLGRIFVTVPLSVLVFVIHFSLDRPQQFYDLLPVTSCSVGLKNAGPFRLVRYLTQHLQTYPLFTELRPVENNLLGSKARQKASRETSIPSFGHFCSGAIPSQEMLPQTTIFQITIDRLTVVVVDVDIYVALLVVVVVVVVALVVFCVDVVAVYYYCCLLLLLLFLLLLLMLLLLWFVVEAVLLVVVAALRVYIDDVVRCCRFAKPNGHFFLKKRKPRAKQSPH
jgi:hypothetical protein